MTNNFQNYKHYKLPISLNPLEYGKLMLKIDNKYIISVGTRTIAIVTQYNEFNDIKFFRKGDLIFNYKDHKINENTFIRSLEDSKFTFKNNVLIEKSILRTLIENILITLILYFIFFVIFPENSSDLLLSGTIIKLRKVRAKYNWTDVLFNINNKVFTKILFEKIFNQFWNSIFFQFTDNNHMFILFKVKYTNSDFSTIGKIQRINKSDKNWYIDFILENMKFKSEYYNETQIESFIFSYGFKNMIIQNKDTLNDNVTFQKYKNNNLPISMNPIDYGRLILKNKIESVINYIIQYKDLTINFNQFDNYNEVEFFKSGISLIKFKDILINKSKFMRIIDNKKFWFENRAQVLFTSEIKSKFISKTEKTKKIVNNFITLDIETFVQNNILVPYLICFYDGNNIYSFGLWNYETVEMMILDCLKSIFIRKYNGYKVYIHNMANFDIIFLLKYIVKVATLKPVIHNGRIISLTIHYGNNNEYQIQFKDSYLLLLSSLMKLSKSFGVLNPKSLFPFNFVNKDNLNYIGDVPDIKYFIKLSQQNYNEYKSKFNNNWNLKIESIKYCELDCVSLYQVLIKFNAMIFDLFQRNVHNYPTLPSLAFAIFRSNFMKNENIPQLSGKIANDIRQGYTGGAVDMYIPKPPKGVKIKGFDVNSLYPKQMFDRLMPIGNPTYFEGNIRAIDPTAFGFFYCNIIAPDNIKHPILQTHVKINNMTRTIAPIGNWSDMLFSMEMDNSIKLGYKFEIIWGYFFNKENIFKDYVEFLYNLRNEYPKTDPMNYIAKILLNSLYGRFGMDDNFTNIEVVHRDYFADFENKFIDQIEEKVYLGDHILVFLNKLEKLKPEDQSTHNVSIGIAAAITAYSRMHMSQFKNNPNINLYYTDTDSIYTDSEIDPSLIDNKILGKLKLENTCEKAIFLSPKVYCLINDNKEFIYKVKGLKHEVDLTFKDFENLLVKDFIIEKTQTKWSKNLTEGKINLLNELYTLKTTDNKRQLVYKNNKLVETKSYRINKDKTIKK